MNKDQVKGHTEEVKGKVKEVAGKIIGDDHMEQSGNVQKSSGQLQAGIGDTKEELKKHAKE
jgi:uncharacterized protein YjbJ (UPF0337 family)